MILYPWDIKYVEANQFYCDIKLYQIYARGFLDDKIYKTIFIDRNLSVWKIINMDENNCKKILCF